MEPTPGMTVKLKHGVLALSARVVQHVTAVKKLKVNEGESFDEREPYLSQADVDGEGGYWIQTDRTKGEWWAHSRGIRSRLC